MGRLVKKFFEYVKEDLNPSREATRPELDLDLEDEDGGVTWGAGEGAQDEDELDHPIKPKMGDDSEFVGEDELEEEEPGYEGGRMLLDLSKKLGKKVINNEIDYNGSTITCYSEDNKFRLDDQIIGSTVEEALENLNGGKSNDFEEEEVLERRSHRHTCKCGKCK